MNDYSSVFPNFAQPSSLLTSLTVISSLSSKQLAKAARKKAIATATHC